MDYIDLSSDNGEVDFSQLAGEVAGVFIRTTLGVGTVDKNAAANAAYAKNNSIPISYYCVPYFHPGVDPATDATNQADFFLKSIQGLPDSNYVAVDLETPCALSQADFETFLQTFIGVLNYGAKTVIYSYKSYLDQHLPEGHTFGSYLLWLANYNSGTPPLPNGWTQGWLHQYTETGVMPGVKTHVDLSALM